MPVHAILTWRVPLPKLGGVGGSDTGDAATASIGIDAGGAAS